MVVAAIGILAGIVIIAVNPGKQLAAARNARRQSDVASIAQALSQYSLDHDGELPDSITSDTKMIGSAAAGCAVTCGPTIASLSSGFSASDADKSAFDKGTYSNTRFTPVSNGVTLASGMTGSYLSSVKDSENTSTIWTNLTWASAYPISKELPDDNSKETAYQGGNIDMAGNIVLLHLNESAGKTTFSDTSGSNFNVACGGTVCPAAGGPGVLNTAVHLDGLNDFFRIHDTSALEYTGGNMSFSVWINPDVGETGGYIISKPWNGNGQYNYRLSYGSADGKWVTLLCVAATSQICVTTPPRPIEGAWTHVLATVSPSVLKIYLNGAESASTSNTITDWVPSKGNNKIDLSFGTLFPYSFSWSGKEDFSFLGSVDEIALFSRVISPTEALDLYRRGGARLRLQARTCADSSCSSSTFIGPDGTAGTFFAESAPLSPLPANRYFQYKAFLDTANTNASPALARASMTGTIPPPVQSGAIGIPTADACIDLASALAGSYITDLPNDPLSGSAEKTLYAVSRSDKGVVTVTSCASENGTIVQAKQ